MENYFSPYLGVTHRGCAAVLRKFSTAPREWFDSEQAKRFTKMLLDLADRDGVREAVDNALAIIVASA